MSSNSNVPNSLRALGVTRLDIRELNLSVNNLTSLPPEISNLKNLETLFLANNKLEQLPPQIGKLTNLKYLYLGYNKLTSLPESIGNLKKLEYLSLRRNNLTSLPESIGNLKKLEYLYLENNPNLKYINSSLYRSGLKIFKNSSTKILIPRKNVPLNTNRNDPISGYNFSVGNNALNLGYNRYLTENSLLKWIKEKNPSTNITNIITLYYLSPNTKIVSNPFTRQPLFRRNLNFVKFVKPPPTNKKNNKPPTKKQKTGNSAQSRRTNRNNIR